MPKRNLCEPCFDKERREYNRAVADRVLENGTTISVCRYCEREGVAKSYSPKLAVGAPDFGGAPSNSTATSQEAARLMDGKVSDQCWQTLGLLASFGPDGATREQVQKRSASKLTNQALCGRLNALQAAGYIYTDGERREAETRMTQQVYRISAFRTEQRKAA